MLCVRHPTDRTNVAWLFTLPLTPAHTYIEKTYHFASSFPSLPLPCFSSHAAAHQRPVSSPPRRPLSPGAPNARRSGGPLPHPSEIHRARVGSMNMAWRCCRGVADSPPPPYGALSHPGDRAPPTSTAMVLPAPHLPLSPPS
jgi:hypothetical protein